MRISLFLLGYRTFEIKKEERVNAVNLLLKRGFYADFSENGEFDVPLYKCKKYIAVLEKTGCGVSEIKGAPSIVFKNRKRYGLLLGLFLIIIYFVFISNFIFDVRISGNERVSDLVIEKELKDIGFYAGNTWDSLSCNEAEIKLLESSDNIGWVNINRRGNVAYVTVKEKNLYEEKEESKGYSNIVASADAVIDEIIVKSGIACVKAGDTVKKGELLISGIIPIELGGGFVKAEGEIYAKVGETISVQVPYSEMKNAYGEEKLSEINLKVLKFSANIFKSYGKIDNGCVIIEDVKECAVFGKYRLPLEIQKIYRAEKVENEVSYDEAKIVSIASVRLASLRQMKLANYELCKIKTYGAFSDSGYKMSSDVTYIRNIGEEKYFFFNADDER